MAIYQNKVIKMKKISKKWDFFLIEDSIKKLILIRVLKIIQSTFTFLIFPFQELISQVKPINLTLILTKLRAVSTFLSPSVFKTPLVGKVLDL